MVGQRGGIFRGMECEFPGCPGAGFSRIEYSGHKTGEKSEFGEHAETRGDSDRMSQNVVD